MKKRHERSLAQTIALARDCILGPPKRPFLKPLDPPKEHKIWGETHLCRHQAAGLNFLHIGKCGGTSIRGNLFDRGVFITEDHMHPPRALPGWVLIWVRHPMRRFVSAFNYSKSIVDFDTDGMDENDLTFDNCPAPDIIARRIRTGSAFTPKYESLINAFESANAFAESLSSPNPALREQAEALFAQPSEHIARGIGYHLYNGQWVERHHKRILMVGCLESMDADFAQLADMLDLGDKTRTGSTHRRHGAATYDKTLLPKAQRNLAEAFEATEYPALKALAAHGHLSAERLEQYLS